MFQVALFAATDTAMERRRLPLQKRLVVGMADDAFRRLDAGDRCVACGAIVFQMRMSGRQLAGFGQALPGCGLFQRRFARRHDPQNDEQNACNNVDPFAFHVSFQPCFFFCRSRTSLISTFRRSD